VPPARSIRYGPFARLADRLSGRADGKRGIPPVPSDAGDGRVRPAYTMRLEQLRSVRDDAVHRQEQRFRAATRVGRDQLADARAALRRSEAALVDLEERLVELGPGPAEHEMVLRSAEGRTTAEDVTHYRRARDRATRIDSVRRQREQLRDQARQHTEDIDRLEGQLAERAAIGRAQAMRQVEYARRRTATYWYWLTRRHPDGSAVLATLRPDDDELPEWLRAPAGQP
jgi:hypothetical protein